MHAWLFSWWKLDTNVHSTRLIILLVLISNNVIKLTSCKNISPILCSSDHLPILEWRISSSSPLKSRILYIRANNENYEAYTQQKRKKTLWNKQDDRGRIIDELASWKVTTSTNETVVSLSKHKKYEPKAVVTHGTILFALATKNFYLMLQELWNQNVALVVRGQILQQNRWNNVANIGDIWIYVQSLRFLSRTVLRMSSYQCE